MADYSIEVAIPNQGPVGPQGPPGEFGELEAPEDGIIYGRKDAEWVDMTSPANLQVRRGTAAEVAAITPLEGEPVWATDTKRLSIGDGVSAGGYIINPAQFVITTPRSANGPFVSFAIPAQSSFAVTLFVSIELIEEASELSMRWGSVIVGENNYTALPQGITLDGYWNEFSSAGIVPTQTQLNQLGLVYSGIVGDTDEAAIVQHGIATNSSAQSATIGIYASSDFDEINLLAGYLKTERIS
jgi:hypothetical protein